MKRKLEFLIYGREERKVFLLCKDLVKADGIDLCDAVADELEIGAYLKIKEKYYSSLTGHVHYLIVRHYDSSLEALKYIKELINLKNGWEVTFHKELTDKELTDKELTDKELTDKEEDEISDPKEIVKNLIHQLISTKH